MIEVEAGQRVTLRVKPVDGARAIDWRWTGPRGALTSTSNHLSWIAQPQDSGFYLAFDGECYAIIELRVKATGHLVNEAGIMFRTDSGSLVMVV